MDLGISGKIAVVSGASRGIGRAVALALAGEGVQLALVASSASNAESTAELCRVCGVTVKTYGADMGSFEAVQQLGASILKDFERVDILVNNAGVTRDGLLMRMSEADWDQVLDVNLKGAFGLTRSLSRVMLKNRGARIINMASVVGLAGNAGQANYAASKGGLIAMTRSLAKEFGARGVLVNAIAPGFIATDMTAALTDEQRHAMQENIVLARAGTAEDIANGVLFLASNLSNYITGQVLVVDGGLKL
ncbi:MAG: 3-oxoacyl-[acyl-carrier-protein] reductase [Planctomycetes bacterium]|nr:3-oxoacyl-[acyl-carrier-protein] reductase [Planctomycetota bacterium]